MKRGKLKLPKATSPVQSGRFKTGLTQTFSRSGMSMYGSMPIWVWVLILGCIAAIFLNIQKARKLTRTRITLEQTKYAVHRFTEETGRCPRSWNELMLGSDAPSKGRSWLGRAPKDAWGNELLVRCASPEDRDPEVLSAGEDMDFKRFPNLP